MILKSKRKEKKRKNQKKPAKPKLHLCSYLASCSILFLIPGPSSLPIYHCWLSLDHQKISGLREIVTHRLNDIKWASEIQESDYTLAPVLDKKETYAERSKSNHWDRIYSIDYQFR